MAWGNSNVGSLSGGAGGSGVNKNLLTNWYFANPVNRRGGFCFVTKGTPCYMDTALTPTDDRTDDTYPVEVVDETYSRFVSNGGNPWYVSTADVKHGYHKTGATIDRWYTNAGNLTVSIGDNSIDLTSIYKYHTFYQSIVNTEQYRGQTMTASLYVDSIDKESSFQFGLRTVSESALNNSILLSNSGVYSITWTIPDDATELQFFIQSMIDSAGTISIKAVKLELGDTQTLAYQDDNGNWQLYEIPNYEEEYAKCVAIEPKVFNDNLLMNWYFKTPVNRKNGYYVPKGVVAYSDAALTTQYTASVQNVYPATIVNSTYATFTSSVGDTVYCKTSDCKKGYVTGGNTIDCWWNRVNNASDATAALLTEDGLRYEVIKTSTSSAWNRFLNQRIEDYKNLLGKQVTLSFLVRDCFSNVTSNFFGVGMHSSVRIDYNSTNLGNVWKNKTGLYSVTLTVPEVINSSHTGLNVFIAIQSGANTVSVGDYVTIEAVKLELGNKQTLAHQDKDGNWVLNEIPDYQEMYEKCSVYPVEHEEAYIGNGGFVPTSGNVTMTGALYAHEGTDYTTSRMRNIAATTATMTAGKSSLANGNILLQYE